MSQLPRSAAAYITVLSLLALGLSLGFSALLTSPNGDTLVLALACLGLMKLAWLRPLPRSLQRKLYLDDGVLIAAILLLEPGAAMLIAGAGTLAAQAIRHEDRTQALFNTAQIMLKAGVGATVLAAFGVDLDREFASGLNVVGPVLVASLAMFVANHLMVATMVALAMSEPLPRVWYQTARELNATEGAEFLVQIVLGTLVAVLTTVAPWALLPVLVLAILVYRFLEGTIVRRWQSEEQAGAIAVAANHDTMGAPGKAIDGTKHGAAYD